MDCVKDEKIQFLENEVRSFRDRGLTERDVLIVDITKHIGSDLTIENVP